MGGSSEEEHNARLQALFQVLLRYGFRLNSNKIKIATDRVQFLGFDLFHGTYSLQSFILSQQQAPPRARSQQEVRKLLGLFNFVRGFVPRLDVLLLLLQEVKKINGAKKVIAALQDTCCSI